MSISRILSLIIAGIYMLVVFLWGRYIWDVIWVSRVGAGMSWALPASPIIGFVCIWLCDRHEGSGEIAVLKFMGRVILLLPLIIGIVWVFID